MSDDRRASVRRRVALPFNWAELTAEATAMELCDVLAVPRALAVRSRLADLDDEFARAAAAIGDARVADAVRALDRKVGVLEEALLAELPLPQAAELELSADGIGFAASRALPVDTWIGIHLVLPVSYHLVGLARVSRCAPPASGEPERHRIGAEFHGLEAPAARRLTRFAIGRDPQPED